MYIDWKDYNGIISACQKYGDASRGGDPQLWSMALEYFSSYDDDCTEQASGRLPSTTTSAMLPLRPSISQQHSFCRVVSKRKAGVAVLHFGFQAMLAPVAIWAAEVVTLTLK